MTAGAVEILAIHTHMYVQNLVGFHERGIQVSVLDAVASTAKEVTGSTVFSRGSADTLSNRVPVGRIICFLVARKNGGFGYRIAGSRREFFVCSGLFMAHKTINLCRVGKVKIFILPSVAGMTRCATSLVALYIDSEVVNG